MFRRVHKSSCLGSEVLTLDSLELKGAASTMWKWLSVLFLLMVGGVAMAAEKKNIGELIRLIKASPRDAARRDLAGSLRKQVPESSEDIRSLLDELSGELAPIAQEVLRSTTSRDLVPALVQGSEGLSASLKNYREEDYVGLTREQREDNLARRMGLEAVIAALGSIKDQRAEPILKRLMEYDSLRYPASVALSRMGDGATFEDLLQRVGKEKGVTLAGIDAKRLKRIVEEIDDPGTDMRRRGALLGQIKGSKNTATNAMLEELTLHHKSADVRSQAGLALFNSIVADRAVVSKGFLEAWASVATIDEEEDLAKAWAVLAIDKAWHESYVPAMILILKENRSPAARGEAARVLGDHKVDEAVPYLKSALDHDSDSFVRSCTFGALRQISGRTYRFTHPEDITARSRYLKKFPGDRGQDEVYEGE